MQTYSLTYSIPYIIVFILLVFLAFIEKRIIKSQKRYLQILSFLIFVFFVGFRGYVGWDWYSYNDLFETVGSFGSDISSRIKSNILQILAPGFILLIQGFKLLNDDYLFFSTFITIISALFFLYLFKKYNVLVSFGFALLITFGLNIQFDLIRNNLSILLFLYSIDFVLRKKAKSYFVINIVGASIHLSSIIFLPLYFFLNKNFNNLFNKALVLLGILFYFLQINISNILVNFVSIFSSDLESKFQVYSSIDSYLISDLNYLYLLVKIIFAFLLFKYYDKIVSQEKNVLPFINISLLNIYSFLYFSGFSVIQSRLQILFVLSFLITVPYILKNIRFNIIAYSIFVIFQIASIGVRYKVILFNYENYLISRPDIAKSKMIFESNAPIINPLN